MIICWNENEMKQHLLLLRSSDNRDVFDLSASDNSITPSGPRSFTVLSENEMIKNNVTVKLQQSQR
jgi:hypothetical protein